MIRINVQWSRCADAGWILKVLLQFFQHFPKRMLLQSITL